MRSSYLTSCLLSSVVIVSGCSQTGAFGSSNTSDVKTIASVGDKPLPIVSGEPGTSLRADPEDIDRPVRPARGSPAGFTTNAVSPSRMPRFASQWEAPPAEKAVVATTDRSGAFTLAGLRSGSSYTVSRNMRTKRDDVRPGTVKAPRPMSASRCRLTAEPIKATPRSARHGHGSSHLECRFVGRRIAPTR